MAKEIFIARFSLIIKRLERSPATIEQILNYLKTQTDYPDKDFSITIRTFQRDIKDIYTQLSIEIKNENKGDFRYYIENPSETKEYSQRILDSYNIIYAINASQNFADIVFLETRRTKGSEHFNTLLNAIRNKKIVTFEHFKYWDETLTNRKVHPLGLKESQGRWYLLAVDLKDNKLKTFGIDRITNIDVSQPKFRETYSYNLKELFTHSFGIINGEDEKPQVIRLKFSYQEGQYVKTYPLHSSQEIIQENSKGTILEFYMCITYDFIKELLSFGPELEVISPAKLRNEVKKKLLNTLKFYK